MTPETILPDDDASRTRREALVMKLNTMRLQSMTARAASGELSGHLAYILAQIRDSERELEARRADRHHQDKVRERIIEERIALLRKIESATREKQTEAGARAGELGRSAETMLKAAQSELHNLGIAHVL